MQGDPNKVKSSPIMDPMKKSTTPKKSMVGKGDYGTMGREATKGSAKSSTAGTTKKVGISKVSFPKGSRKKK